MQQLHGFLLLGSFIYIYSTSYRTIPMVKWGILTKLTFLHIFFLIFFIIVSNQKFSPESLIWGGGNKVANIYLIYRRNIIFNLTIWSFKAVKLFNYVQTRWHYFCMTF